MEMKHHKGGHQISNVIIPFHHLPEEVTVGEAVQAITLLAGAGQSGSAAAAVATPATSSAAARKAAAASRAALKAEDNGSGVNGGVDGDHGSEKKGGKAGQKQDGGAAETSTRGNGKGGKRKQTMTVKQEFAGSSSQQQQAEALAAAQQAQQQQLHAQQQTMLSTMPMLPYPSSSPVYLQHGSGMPGGFTQLSPSSPSTAASMYPQLPNVPSSLPLSISAFDPSLLQLQQQATTPNPSTLSPSTSSLLLAGNLSPNTLFSLPLPDHYSALLHKSQQQLNFYISSNSAFGKVGKGEGGKGDEADSDGRGGGGSGSGEKRRKVEGGNGISGSASSAGEDGEAKAEGSQDETSSTLSSLSASEERLMAAAASSSSSSASSSAKRQRDVSALDPMSDFFLLRSESAASSISLTGSGVALHSFTPPSSAMPQHLLTPPPSSAFSSASLSKPGHPTPIKIPTASRLSPSLSPLLSQSLSMSLSPSPSLVPLGSYTLSPPPNTPSLMDSEGLFAITSANAEGGGVRRSM